MKELQAAKSLKFFSESELEERRKDLVEIKNALDALSVRFFLSDGILLGAVRDKKFIKWDWDVELGLYAEEAHKNTAIILTTLHEQGFDIINVDPALKRFKINVRKRGTKFSLIGFYEQGKWRKREKLRYPTRFFKNMQEIEFLGQNYLCLSPPEEYLEYQYGDWRVPKQEVDENKYLEKRIYSPSFFLTDRIAFLCRRIKQFAHVLMLRLHPAPREPLFNFMLQQAVKPGATFIDIGSNDGFEAITALKITKGRIKVFLIGPDSGNLRRAKMNIEKQQKKCASAVTYLNYCVSDKTGKGVFFCSPDAPNLNSATKTRKEQNPVEADFITLEDLFRKEDIKQPVVIKMDIEGHEVEVLRKAKGILEQMRDVQILMEVHPSYYNAEHSLRNALEDLFKMGFKTSFMESAGLPMPAKFLELKLKPVRLAGNRGLYSGVAEDIVLDLACREHVDMVNYHPWFTRKIVRSVLLKKII
jgi:lipopolysaccharide cholinephosphotransferase